MTKDVLITISGVQMLDDDDEDVEMVTRGDYYQKNGKHYIMYDEQMAVSYTHLDVYKRQLVAFVNSYFLASIFKRYMPKEDTERGNGMRPLFEDEDEETLAAIRSLKGEDAEK